MAKGNVVDRRYAVAAQLLGLPNAVVAEQHSGLVNDLLYVWAEPLGQTVLMRDAKHHMLFEPGVLLPKALITFRQRFATEN